MRIKRLLATSVVLALTLVPFYGSPAQAATTTVNVGQTNGGTTAAQQFNAAAITITSGDTVQWNWFNGTHNVTAYTETTPGTPDWQSPLLSGTGQSFARAFSGAGTVVTYYCSIHAGRNDADPAQINTAISSGKMVGKITINAPVPDTTAPSVSSITTTPNPTNGAASITLSAQVVDSGTPLGTIAAAEYSIGASAAAAGSGTAMTAVDGAFNSSSEAVTATVNVSSYAAGSTITLWVRGKDNANNWSTAQSVTVSITGAPAGSLQATVTVNAGSLSNATGGSTSLPFGAAGLTGEDLQLPYSPTTAWRAIDARGTGAGWNITVASTDFTSGSGGIAASNFKVQLLANKIVKISGNTVPTSAVASYQPLGTTPLKILSAGLGQGMGTYDYTPDFQLTVPAQAIADTYTAVVTVSLNSGP